MAHEGLLSTSKHELVFRRFLRLPYTLPLFIFLIVFGGCAPTASFLTADRFEQPSPAVHVLLMQPDVQLSELSAGGLAEPKAEWTAAAEKNITKALTDLLQERKDTLVLYQRADSDPATLRLHTQLIKLYEAVGVTILIHKYNQYYALPTKKESFDWSLGEGVKSLREQFNADYALFVYLRESHATPGRVAVMVAAALLGRVIMPLGSQVGFASLVDLRSGQIVWFNKLGPGGGDLRKPGSARETVEHLLTEIPL